MKTHNISSARYVAADDLVNVIIVQDNGAEASTTIHSDVDGGGMLAFLAGGGVIAPYVAPVVVLTADDVRAEAQRRIIAMTGATSLIETIVKQSNANMRANELNDKRLNGETLTAQEQAEADGLRALADAIKAIRAASNVMEANPPANYKDDSNWP